MVRRCRNDKQTVTEPVKTQRQIPETVVIKLQPRGLSLPVESETLELEVRSTNFQEAVGIRECKVLIGCSAASITVRLESESTIAFKSAMLSNPSRCAR